MNRIAVDAMGGDHAPAVEVAGAVAAVREEAVRVALVGDRERLLAELDRTGAMREERIDIVHASEVVTMDDAPAQVFRAKRDSSMRVGFDLVKAGEAQGVVSAGNSGAMLTHGLFVLGRLPGVERPGIVTVLPTPTGTLVLCDTGANVEVKPTTMAQFGMLGVCYDRIVHGRSRPRLGLLSNGTEPSKGTELTRATDALLAAASQGPDAPFRYLGYIEASHIFRGEVDVIATDGFTGNVVLKLCEGMAEALLRMLQRNLMASARGRVAATLVRPALMDLKKSIDYSETGGALLAGVAGVVTICHGRSDVVAVKNAIKLSDRFARLGLVAKLGDAVSQAMATWSADVP